VLACVEIYGTTKITDSDKCNTLYVYMYVCMYYVIYGWQQATLNSVIIQKGFDTFDIEWVKGLRN